MSHKEKICQPALTSHIETSHKQCTYTPLIVSKKIWKEAPEKPGLSSVINLEIDELLESKVNEIKKETDEVSEILKSNIEKAFTETSKKACKKTHSLSINNLKTEAINLVDKNLQFQFVEAVDNTRQEIIQLSKGKLNLNNPKASIDARVTSIEGLVEEAAVQNLDFKPIPNILTCELDGLGLFFSESVKYRCEGKAYSPCGEEITILPGETINETNVLKTSLVSETSAENTISENLTSTNRNEVTDTFEDSFERNLTKELDLKYSQEMNVGLKIPFEILSLDLSSKSNTSVGFKRVLNEVSKSSHKQTKNRFDEIVREIKTSSNSKSSLTSTSSEENVFNRKWENTTDKPQIYMRRKGYCKTSVIHSRHNVQLAWTGCIDDPAKDLCTPDNIKEKHTAQIQAIKNKWVNSAAPIEFGPRPKGKKVCTDVRESRRNVVFGASTHRLDFDFTIDPGWSYESGSASIIIVDTNSTPVGNPFFLNQPNNGSRGAINFDAQVLIKNLGGKSEWVSFKVCFNVIPDSAVEWDTKVDAWKDEKAQEEIDAFLAEKTEELNAFLATDQARATIERQIMQNYFGVTTIEDCCKLIARLRKLFDFDSLCFSLLPSWNEMGDGCQKSFPVNIYTAKCLHFYLPVREGHEMEAVILLASINAIPWNAQLIPQIMAYVNQIQTMRDTVYNRTFDPTGWDVKFDLPKGYDMTPYDTTSTNWLADFESMLNYELLGAFTINVPCGERLEPRPLLCE